MTRELIGAESPVGWLARRRPPQRVHPGHHPGETTTDNAKAPITRASRRRYFIARHWTIACDSRACVNCECGRSLKFELGGEGANRNGYGLAG